MYLYMFSRLEVVLAMLGGEGVLVISIEKFSLKSSLVLLGSRCANYYANSNCAISQRRGVFKLIIGVKLVQTIHHQEAWDTNNSNLLIRSIQKEAGGEILS